MHWKRHPDFPDAKKLERAHPTDSGFDIFAAEDTTIVAGDVVAVRTGICVQVEAIQKGSDKFDEATFETTYNQPGGWTLGVYAWDKSGLGAKGLKLHGGVIDNPYTGEILIIMGYPKTASIIKNLFHLLTMVGSRAFKVPTGEYHDAFKIKKHQKIANIVVQRTELPILDDEPSELNVTDRGDNGGGSTGI